VTKGAARCAAMLIALTFGATQGVARAAECVVRGSAVTLQALTVHPKDDASFQIGISKMPVTATIHKHKGSLLDLDVTGAFSFAALRRNVWFTAAADFSSSDGMVKIHPGARLTNTRVEGEAIVASVILYANDVLEGEDKTPDELVDPVRIPCSLLMFGPLKTTDEEKRSATPGEWWAPKTDTYRVRLHSRPFDGAPYVDVKTPPCDNCLEFELLEEQGAWLHVERTGERASANGWIRRSLMRRIPAGSGRGWGCGGNHERRYRWYHNSRVQHYDGPATLREGTKVFSSPPHGEWAIINSELEVEVRHFKGKEWVELYGVPGLVGLFGAYVPLDAVFFPGGVESP